MRIQNVSKYNTIIKVRKLGENDIKKEKRDYYHTLNNNIKFM